MRRVTDILRDAGLREDMAWMTPEQQDWYKNRGTQIHAATVMVDRGTLDWDALDGEIVGHVRGYEKFIKAVTPIVCAVEKEVICVKHDYLGHLDRVYRIGGVPVVCDIKTTTCDLTTRLQTMAYKMAARQGGRRMGLALHSDGTFRAYWYIEPWADAVDTEGWLAAVNGDTAGIAKWKERVGWKDKGVNRKE